MEYTVTQDDIGTHIDWKHEGVTAEMIDWFWSNMEKGFILWHPEEHEPLVWKCRQSTAIQSTRFTLRRRHGRMARARICTSDSKISMIFR